MTHEEKHTLVEIVTGKPFEVRPRLLKFLETVVVDEKAPETKSRSQEKSYHLLFSQIASHCVAHGIDLKMALEKINKYEVSVTQEFVKSTWRAILKTQTGKDSTRDQTKEDIKNIEPEFKRLWEDITGEPVNFPSRDLQHYEQIAESYAHH